MDTTENEIQALRKEVDDFRNENVDLYNELTKQNKALYEEIVSLRQENINLHKELANQCQFIFRIISHFNSKHLNNHLTYLAGIQTAQFIVEHMKKIKHFDTREEHLKYALSQSNLVGGALYMEFGVFEGNSINMISEIKSDKIVYGFDSFEGLPEDWRMEFLKGRFNRNGKLPKVRENVRLIKGWFNETLSDFIKEHPEPCAFIHIDCDLYSSTKTVLNTLRNQIVSGTIISFDEYYNYPGWQHDGEYKAFTEFTTWNNIEFEYLARSNLGQVSVRIK